MSLRERLEADMKAAMKSRDTLRLETIRGVRGAMRNKEIELGETLDDEAILRVIRTLVKQRIDSIEQFQAAGRDELVAKETAERQLLESYLPAALDPAAVEPVVAAVIAELGAQGPKDMGRVMKAVLEKLGAAADGKLVSQVVKRRLAGG
ncbi:MAG TPA: GatB/YqeY domain-containing protein [Myxococcota bacterium]